MISGKQKILVIDDDSECLDFARDVLMHEGYEVITAMDGQEGLKKAETEHPDLIVLDVMMPEQSGWDTCDKLKALKGAGNTPVVFLTCVETPKTLYEPHGAFETDWDEYLTKPVSPKKLLEVVRTLLKDSASVR